MKIFVRILLVFALAASVFAQQEKKAADQPPRKDLAETHDSTPTYNFFKLNFTVYELNDGKRTNQRDYMMIARADNQASASSIRIGTRVPVYTDEKKMTYVDAGLSIRCYMKEQADQKVQAQCDVEVSSFVRADQVASSGSETPAAPVLRTTHTSSWALLTLSKPAVIATLDDVNSAKRMQIEVTATKMD